MDEERIVELVKAFGFTGNEADAALRLCHEIERETRQGYFRLIQVANDAASSVSINARELDLFVWNKEQSKRVTT